MQIKRNKFWTVVFSFIPGAGHMYMGFMKLGLSFMVLFTIPIVLAAIFSLEVMAAPLPIIFFFSFFDSINKMSLTDEKFAMLVDDYLFTSFKGELPFDFKGIFSKSRPIIGALLIFCGVYLVGRSLFWQMHDLLTERASRVLSYLISNLPQFALAAVVILIGARLIAGKKQEVE